MSSLLIVFKKNVSPMNIAAILGVHPAYIETLIALESHEVDPDSYMVIKQAFGLSNVWVLGGRFYAKVRTSMRGEKGFIIPKALHYGSLLNSSLPINPESSIQESIIKNWVKEVRFH